MQLSLFSLKNLLVSKGKSALATNLMENSILASTTKKKIPHFCKLIFNRINIFTEYRIKKRRNKSRIFITGITSNRKKFLHKKSIKIPLQSNYITNKKEKRLEKIPYLLSLLLSELYLATYIKIVKKVTYYKTTLRKNKFKNTWPTACLGKKYMSKFYFKKNVSNSKRYKKRWNKILQRWINKTVRKKRLKFWKEKFYKDRLKEKFFQNCLIDSKKFKTIFKNNQYVTVLGKIKESNNITLTNKYSKLKLGRKMPLKSKLSKKKKFSKNTNKIKTKTKNKNKKQSIRF